MHGFSKVSALVNLLHKATIYRLLRICGPVKACSRALASPSCCCNRVSCCSWCCSSACIVFRLVASTASFASRRAATWVAGELLSVSKETYYSVKRDLLQCQKRAATWRASSAPSAVNSSHPPSLRASAACFSLGFSLGLSAVNSSHLPSLRASAAHEAAPQTWRRSEVC
jgi:hypothetical protein